MKKYIVYVEKLQRINGAVEVEADSVDEATAIVDQKILSGTFREHEAEWDDKYPYYVDGSLKPTGDVDEL